MSAAPTGDQPEARHTSGVTTNLVLAYVERHGGPAAVDRLLETTGLTDREATLRDERAWVSFATKIALFEGAAEVLDDPHFGEHMGADALELGVATALRLALRAFGSPRMVYANVARASARFSWSHRMEVDRLDRTSARIRWVDVTGSGFHELDCQYNRGLLSTAPLLFGLPRAHVAHPECALRGGEACVYDLRWEERAGRPTRALRRLRLGRRAEAARIEAARAAEQQEITEGLRASLNDLVSDLDLDEVLAKVVGHAHVAAGGRDFVLLLREPDGTLTARAASPGADALTGAVEDWAADRPELVREVVVLDDAAGLAGAGSVCTAPLVLRDEPLGALVAAGDARDAFLPQDIALLEAYAAQAAIAVHNARMVRRLETLASRDPLTGLLNHREFHETLEREIERARRGDGRFGILLLDVDRLKRLNDEQGHVAGDAALRRVADQVTECCRGSDVAFRVGGDEFAVILPDARAEDAHRVGQRLRTAVAELPDDIGLSYGSAAWPADGPGKEALLLRADGRLYSAKPSDRSGRALVPGAPAGTPEPSTLTERVLTVGLEALGLECGALQEVRGGHHVFRTTVGPIEHYGIAPGAAVALHETLAQRMSDAGVDDLVDPSAEAYTRDLNIVTRSGMRAYVATPVRLSCGRPFGALAWAGRQPRGPLTASERRLLDLLSDVMAREIEREGRAEEAAMTGVHALLAALEARDDYTGQHSESVVELASLVSRVLGLSVREQRSVEQVALLHDVGKVGVPDEILRKRGPLTETEWTAMRRHPEIGERIVAAIPPLAHLAPAIRGEHERWDGGGYPDGLRGEQIPIASRIVFACDALHAMTSDRPYRAALSISAARAELDEHAGSQFDPEVVEALLEVLASGHGVLDDAEAVDLHAHDVA